MTSALRISADGAAYDDDVGGERPMPHAAGRPPVAVAVILGGLNHEMEQTLARMHGEYAAAQERLAQATVDEDFGAAGPT